MIYLTPESHALKSCHRWIINQETSSWSAHTFLKQKNKGTLMTAYSDEKFSTLSSWLFQHKYAWYIRKFPLPSSTHHCTPLSPNHRHFLNQDKLQADIVSLSVLQHQSPKRYLYSIANLSGHKAKLILWDLCMFTWGGTQLFFFWFVSVDYTMMRGVVLIVVDDKRLQLKCYSVSP